MRDSTTEKQRILLVDDDPSIRNLYSKALSQAGFAVETAPNGKAAFQTVEQFQPHLIILDLVMPEQEGIETLLQVQSKNPKVPVLAISGAMGASEYLSVANILGARRTLEKPIKAERLVQTVRALLAEAKSQGAG
ncbi:MAG TPA: response regulator [Bryobacteraceae bacterium]|nr:response regulator [Bryobacteraceae bacterium]